MALFTLVGIGIAAITAVLFYVQLSEMTKQTQILASQSEGANAGALVDEMNTRRQLDIAQKQAQAAQDSVDATTKAMQISQRAWVGIVGAKSSDKVAVGVMFRASSTIENFGHSPAHRVWPSTAINIFCYGAFPKNPPYPEGRNPMPFRNGSYDVLMPGETETIAAEFRPLTEADLKIISKFRTCSLYFYREVRYCDIFGKAHYSHRCAQWLPGTDNSFIGCSTYNDTDEDYPKKRSERCEPN